MAAVPLGSRAPRQGGSLRRERTEPSRLDERGRVEVALQVEQAEDLIEDRRWVAEADGRPAPPEPIDQGKGFGIDQARGGQVQHDGVGVAGKALDAARRQEVEIAFEADVEAAAGAGVFHPSSSAMRALRRWARPECTWIALKSRSTPTCWRRR